MARDKVTPVAVRNSYKGEIKLLIEVKQHPLEKSLVTAILNDGIVTEAAG